MKVLPAYYIKCMYKTVCICMKIHHTVDHCLSLSSDSVGQRGEHRGAGLRGFHGQGLHQPVQRGRWPCHQADDRQPCARNGNLVI